MRRLILWSAIGVALAAGTIALWEVASVVVARLQSKRCIASPEDVTNAREMLWRLLPESWHVATDLVSAEDCRLRAAAIGAIGELSKGIPENECSTLRAALLRSLYDPDRTVVSAALGVVFDWGLAYGRPRCEPMELVRSILEREFNDLNDLVFVSPSFGPLVIECSQPQKANYVSGPKKALMYLGRAYTPGELFFRAFREENSEVRAVRRWALENLVFHWGFKPPTARGVREELERAAASGDADTRGLAKAGIELLQWISGATERGIGKATDTERF